MIVVIAIAVLVLVVVAAFFAGRIGSGTGDINLEAAFAQGCNNLRSIHNCAVSEISLITVQGYLPQGTSATQYPNGYPFGGVCTAKGFSALAECAVACGCPRTSTGGGPPPPPVI